MQSQDDYRRFRPAGHSRQVNQKDFLEMIRETRTRAIGMLYVNPAVPVRMARPVRRAYDLSKKSQLIAPTLLAAGKLISLFAHSKGDKVILPRLRAS